jgi:uncharacterized cupredoxin-like copper-binding protein
VSPHRNGPVPDVRRRRLRRVGRAAAVAAVVTVGVAGCGDDGAPAGPGDDLPTLRVVAGGDDGQEDGQDDGTGSEYVYDGPATVPAGPVRVTLANQGSEDHHAQVLRLDGGATLEDLQAALATGDPAAVTEVGSFVGGTGLVSPGEGSRADAVLGLEPGDHVLLCFVSDGAGVPHVAHGMLRPFQVTGADDPPPAPAPEADGEIELDDYAFTVPDRIEGDATLAVTNRSATEAHEMVMARLDEGTTLDDVVAALRAHRPLPARAVGGMQAVPPGTTEHLRLDLDPGRYVLVCAVPSSDGTPHFDAGMIREVTVR